MAATQNFEVDQGAYWSQSLLWKDADDEPIDLTGYTARMYVREEVATAGDPIIELETNPAPGGGVGNARITLGLVESTPGTPLYNILLEIEGSATAALPTSNEKKTWRYDLELLPADDEDQVNRLLEGKFVVNPEVTR